MRLRNLLLANETWSRDSYVTINGLDPYTNYTITVTARNNDGKVSSESSGLWLTRQTRRFHHDYVLKCIMKSSILKVLLPDFLTVKYGELIIEWPLAYTKNL